MSSATSFPTSTSESRIICHEEPSAAKSLFHGSCRSAGILALALAQTLVYVGVDVTETGNWAGWPSSRCIRAVISHCDGPLLRWQSTAAVLCRAAYLCVVSPTRTRTLAQAHRLFCHPSCNCYCHSLFHLINNDGRLRSRLKPHPVLSQ